MCCTDFEGIFDHHHFLFHVGSHLLQWQNTFVVAHPAQGLADPDPELSTDSLHGCLGTVKYAPMKVLQFTLDAPRPLIGMQHILRSVKSCHLL